MRERSRSGVRVLPWGAALCAVAAALGCLGESPPPAEPSPEAARSAAGPGARAEPVACRDHRPERQPFYGDLHVHTRYSMDAYTWDVRATPDDAYRFARGEPLATPPYDAAGRAQRHLRLERPLDFAAVTDHASYLGPVSLCSRPGSPSYDTPGCRVFRGDVHADSLFGKLGARMSGIYDAPQPRPGQPDLYDSSPLSPEVCGEDGSRCRQERAAVWRETRSAAERWNDATPECRFTAFVGYEYTATPELSKVHRNVIFRGDEVPETPTTWLDEPEADGLWRRLEEQCTGAGTGCDVLTIPHNSNLSNGRLFTLAYREASLDEQRRRARRRAALDRLAEITQIKGDSECSNGMYQVMGGPDELCGYEKVRRFRGGAPEDCGLGTGAGALAGRGCQSRLDFVRYALIEGLREAERIGVNPIKIGIIASTDAHNANPGDTEERSYDGWAGLEDATAAGRLSGSGLASGVGVGSNPGGLVGVFAEENSRDSLFDAMARRETFGTSGPRIAPRFFGGWGYDASLCDREDFAARGYAGGVPMGADLPPPSPGAGAPVFAVSARRDPGSPGLPGNQLQRIQIVKGWADDQGRFHQAVHDVAGGENGADVDPDTCEPRGPGRDALCAVWRDPAFEPGRPAVYYARVVENPSCRWSTWQCLALPADERPASCDDPAVPKSIQERAWTSPIWYAPPRGS